jgi:hypothetical protein
MLGLVRPSRIFRYCHTRLFHTERIFKEDPRWPGWEVVVGIEVHAQIKSRRKLFSGRSPCTFHNLWVFLISMLDFHERILDF